MLYMGNIKIVQVPIADLKPAEYNPRKISPQDRNQLKKSIIKFGLIDPIIVNKHKGRENIIIGGHQRYYLAKDLGLKQIPCVYVDIDAEAEKELNLRLNRNTGEFNYELLQEYDIELLEDVGFEDIEIDEFIIGKEPEEDNFDIDKVIEGGEPICKSGDLWQLGDHRLMCGDSTSIEDMKKLIGNNDIKLCFTSPPYNMAGNRYRNYDDNLKSQEYIDFNINTIKNIRPYLKGYLFWNISYNKNSRWEWIEIFYRITKETGINFLEKIVWDKGHGTPITSKKQLTRQYEDIYLGGTETEMENELTEAYLGTTLKNHAFNKRTGKGITNYWRITTGNTQTKKHSACFPVALPVKAILLMSIYNENILDPFIGLGYTLISCEKTTRNCYGMEIDPTYCDVIIKRWSEYTGQEAKRLNG